VYDGQTKEAGLRRSFFTLALGILAAAALAAPAVAKDGGVELSSTPYGTTPGGTWTTGLQLVDVNGRLPANAAPTITVTNLGTGERQTFRATPAGGHGKYTVSVTFPSAGRYSYAVRDGVTDREYTFPPVRIVGSEAAVPVPSSGGEGSFPVWLPVVGGLALLLIASGAGFYARRRRFGLSH
jgi:hypothetical protein